MVESNFSEEPDSRIRKWLDQYTSFSAPAPTTDIKILEAVNEDHVREAAYYISLESNSYDTLCWVLAEKILKKTHLIPADDEIREKAEEIADLRKTYDELCYLNAELDILVIKK